MAKQEASTSCVRSSPGEEELIPSEGSTASGSAWVPALALVVDPRFDLLHDSVRRKFDPPVVVQNHRNTSLTDLIVSSNLLYITLILLLIMSNNYLSTVF